MQVVACLSNLFLFIIESYSIVRMLSQFTHPPVEEHLSCFQFGLNMNRPARNSHVQVFVWTYIFISLGISYLGMGLLNFTRSCQIVFQSGYATLHLYQPCWEFQGLCILTRTCYCKYSFIPAIVTGNKSPALLEFTVWDDIVVKGPVRLADNTLWP